MKKKLPSYSDLSQKQLQVLKETYVDKKVNSMTNKELKEFVTDIISHQITDTIDKEEEIEAWQEMLDFFGEEFEYTISEIKQKYVEDSDLENYLPNPQEQRRELLEKNNIATDKEDMWKD